MCAEDRNLHFYIVGTLVLEMYRILQTYCQQFILKLAMTFLLMTLASSVYVLKQKTWKCKLLSRVLSITINSQITSGFKFIIVKLVSFVSMKPFAFYSIDRCCYQYLCEVRCMLHFNDVILWHVNWKNGIIRYIAGFELNSNCYQWSLKMIYDLSAGPWFTCVRLHSSLVNSIDVCLLSLRSSLIIHKNWLDH